MFELWMLYTIIAVIAIFFEIFVPTMFCINFAIAGILVAIISVFWGNLISLTAIFLVLSLLSLAFLKPILMKLLKKEKAGDFNSQYIGKTVKVIEPITTTRGAVTVYDERWEARLKTGGDEIPVDAEVRIIENDSLVLFVEKV